MRCAEAYGLRVERVDWRCENSQDNRGARPSVPRTAACEPDPNPVGERTRRPREFGFANASWRPAAVGGRPGRSNRGDTFRFHERAVRLCPQAARSARKRWRSRTPAGAASVRRRDSDPVRTQLCAERRSRAHRLSCEFSQRQSTRSTRKPLLPRKRIQLRLVQWAATLPHRSLRGSRKPLRVRQRQLPERVMEPRISIITLGVADLPRSRGLLPRRVRPTLPQEKSGERDRRSSR